MIDKDLILRSRYFQWVLVQIFPGLRAWPVKEWPDALSTSNTKNFDYVEQIGIVAAVVLTSWLLRPAAHAGISLPLAFLSQLAYSLPLLLLAAGPFFLRRMRRSIDEAAKSRRFDI